MPRKPRFFVPHIANHVIQRGNNRQAVFFLKKKIIKRIKITCMKLLKVVVL